jgi:radical SAM superfamily enzyme YgiQ (UPF0313 family)
MRDKTRPTRAIRNRSAARQPCEEGAIVKDWGGRLPVALIYPNAYYLGMSNLGIHTIYKLLNDYDDVVGERVFWEKTNTGRMLPPLSLESRRPLADFAALAFSVSYELDYFNVIALLKSSGIPLYAADRDERHPLLIAGGSCITANPMPLSPFFDCLAIGEAEPILPDMLTVLREGISGNRRGLLEALASLPGVYLPACPPEKPVVRQWARDLDSFATTSVIITDDTELKDLYLIEAERGCRRGCRFCLVNGIFAPARFRSLDSLTAQAEAGLRYRKRIGLVGPAVTDHPDIVALLANLTRIGAQLSVSSLRIGSISGEMIDLLARGNTRTITIAPETGSERLRRLINKNVSASEILEVADMVGGHRFKNLKLYFMIGLPSETDADTEAIIELALAIKSRMDKHGSGMRLNINIAPFVPKAGTPFQWLPMATLETLNRRLAVLRKSLPPRGIIIKAESPAWSRVQGMLSRGDTGVAKVLADMDRISLAGWRQVMAKNNLDADYYLNQKWDTSQGLPWDIIDTGSHCRRLAAEMAKAMGEIG